MSTFSNACNLMLASLVIFVICRSNGLDVSTNSALPSPRSDDDAVEVTTGYIMMVADTDHDGRLSFEEAANYINRYGFNLTEDNMEVFDITLDKDISVPEINRDLNVSEIMIADRNNDGKLSPYEAAKFLEQFGVFVSKQQMKQFDVSPPYGSLSTDEIQAIPPKLFARKMEHKIWKAIQGLVLQADSVEDILRASDFQKLNVTTISDFAKFMKAMTSVEMLSFDIMEMDTDHNGLISEDELEEFKDI